MRLFIAIPLSDAMKDALTAAQDEMYAHGVRGNFTSRENMQYRSKSLILNRVRDF